MKNWSAVLASALTNPNTLDSSIAPITGRPGVRRQLGMPDNQRGDEHERQVIDDVIELRSGEVWQPFLNARGAGKQSVAAVHQHRERRATETPTGSVRPSRPEWPGTPTVRRWRYTHGPATRATAGRPLGPVRSGSGLHPQGRRDNPVLGRVTQDLKAQICRAWRSRERSSNAHQSQAGHRRERTSEGR